MNDKPAKQGSNRNSGTWKPGQSGNPKGRAKKGKTLTDILEKHLRKRRELPAGEKHAAKELLAKELIDRALDGDTAALKYIFDRIDGKPTETVKAAHTGRVEIALERHLYDAVHADDEEEPEE